MQCSLVGNVPCDNLCSSRPLTGATAHRAELRPHSPRTANGVGRAEFASAVAALPADVLRRILRYRVEQGSSHSDGDKAWDALAVP